jgi:hypothetical protein
MEAECVLVRSTSRNHPARALAGLLAALLVAGMASAAAADEEAGEDCRVARDAVVDPDTGEELEPAVEVCTLAVWFTAESPEGRVGNLAGLGLAPYPTWKPEPPEQSVFEGGGAGFASSAADELSDAAANVPVFEGTFTGWMETVAVDLYGYNVGGSIDLGHLHHQGHGFTVTLGVDDAVVTREQVIVTPTQFDDGRLLMRFVFIDLLDALEAHGLESGDDVEHELWVEILPRQEGLDDSLYVYDAEEVPSGMVFNPDPDDLLPYIPVHPSDP